MKWYVQYDNNTGKITAVVGGTRGAPNYPHQLEFDDLPQTEGMKVEDGQLVLSPPPEE